MFSISSPQSTAKLPFGDIVNQNSVLAGKLVVVIVNSFVLLKSSEGITFVI